MQAAAWMAELGYIAMAYISGRSMAATRILMRPLPVTRRTNAMLPTRKRKAENADSRQ